MAAIDPYATSTIPHHLPIPPVNHPSTLRSSSLGLTPHSLMHPTASPVSSYLYSGFIEHLGRGIYGGIVDDPKHPSPENLLIKQDVDGLTKGRAGWRKDVMDVLGKEGDLEMPMLRWPGGG